MRTVIVALTVLTTLARADWFSSDCQEFAERLAVQPAAGVTRVVIIGRAGFLHVEGRAGATEIRATGHACAPIEELLVGMLLSAKRSGSTVTIEASVPKQGSARFAAQPKLDFTVTLPEGMEVDIGDTSGELIISNVGNVRVAATSSDMAIHNISGNAAVRNTSGKIEIGEVRGDVHVPSQSSGNIKIERVGGSVTIDDDGSGSIEIRNVTRDVVIASDGSGSIAVSDVRGGLTLGSKKSGSVDYQRVSGRVSVPARYRR